MNCLPSFPADIAAAARHVLRRELWTSARERPIARAVLERQPASPKQEPALRAIAECLRRAEAEARSPE